MVSLRLGIELLLLAALLQLEVYPECSAVLIWVCRDGTLELYMNTVGAYALVEMQKIVSYK